MKFGNKIIMSRVGKKPIKIPEGVTVDITDNKVRVKGPKGELSQEIRSEIKVEIKEDEITLIPRSARRKSSEDEIIVESKKDKAFWGLYRSLIANMVEGVVKGYEKKLEIEGLGFKVAMQGEDTLILHVGYSHTVDIKNPEGIKFAVEKNVITVTGIDKTLVGQTAAKIRKVKPPEPYKGKGIRYVGEIIRRKVGKKAVAAG